MHRATQKRGLARNAGIRRAAKGAALRLAARPAATKAWQLRDDAAGARELQAAQLRDLTRVRIEIETRAATWATPNLTVTDRHQLRALLARLSSAAEAGDAAGFLRSDRAFHFQIYRAAGSDALLSVIERLWGQAAIHLRLPWEAASRAAVIATRRHILEAIETGDAAQCALHIRAGIEQAATAQMGLLR